MRVKLSVRGSMTRLRRRDDGASAVEFAIIAPLFFMLTFGAITGALAYQQRNELTSAAREGARYGATLPIDQFSTCASPGDCWAKHVRSVTVSRAFGNLAGGAPGRGVCVALVHGAAGGATPLGLAVPGYMVDGGSDADGSFDPIAASSGNYCYDDSQSLGGQDPGARVQVVVQRDGRLNAILFRMNLTLGSEASVQHEEGST